MTDDLPAGSATIAGVGARTHNGFTALQVTMALRADHMDPTMSHMVDAHGEAIATCRDMSIGDDVQGLARFVALAVRPLAEAARPWCENEMRRRGSVRPLPVVVALPSPDRPGFDHDLPRSFLSLVVEGAGLPVDPASRLVFGGRGGGVEAFRLGLELIREGREAVLVGGVDSYFDPDVLEHLASARRLHSLETENGFIPGEAAAFVLLVRSREATALYGYGELLSAVTHAEPQPYGSEEPCIGLGITAAVRDAVAVVGPTSGRIPWALTDVANERHRVDEWSYGITRSHRALHPDAEHEQPLLNTGDVGAASAAMLLSIASVQWQTGCAHGDCVLIGTHSDGPMRGAMVARAK